MIAAIVEALGRAFAALGTLIGPLFAYRAGRASAERDAATTTATILERQRDAASSPPLGRPGLVEWLRGRRR